VPGDSRPNAALDPAFSDGRLLIEIEAWDGSLHVGLSSDLTPPEYRFQGGLSYVRGFDVDGRVVAPGRHRAKKIRLSLSPFGPDTWFGPEGLDEVGQLNIHAAQSGKADFSATLLIPEAALPLAATCLSSVWRYVHVWTFDEDSERASVSAFSFSSTIHRNLEAWARD
jgi:hypothetical protein